MGLGEGLLGKLIVNRCHRVEDQCVKAESREKLRTNRSALSVTEREAKLGSAQTEGVVNLKYWWSIQTGRILCIDSGGQTGAYQRAVDDM